MTCWAIDSLVDFCEDHTNKFAGYLFPAVGSQPISENAGDWLSDYWEKVLTVIEKRLAEHGKPFIAGTDRPTIADFKAFSPVSISLPDCNSATVVPASVQEKLIALIAKHPHYARWVETMKNETSAYCSSRPARPL